VRILRAWHGACILAGCFYVKPIPDVSVNLAPIIFEPSEDPREVIVRGDSVVLTVIAGDPEGDALDFQWPDLANTPYDIAISEIGGRQEITVCRVEILDVDQLDRDIVRALVSDGGRDNLVQVTFRVVRP
jgi:hypothetical protein